MARPYVLSQNDIDYPCEVFRDLIVGNSPYAFYIFQWVPYQTDAALFRLKMLHDVKHFDGRIEYGVWPNGSHCGTFKDSEVEFIRISKTQFGHTYADPKTPHNPTTPTTPTPEENSNG